MARTTLTARSISASHPTLQPTANSLDLAWTAANAADGEQVALTGKEIILIRNVHAADPVNITVDGVALLGRSGSITNYVLQAGEVMVLMLPVDGWRQTADGMLYLEASTTSAEYSVLKVQ